MNETQAIKLCLEARDPRGFEYLVREYRREAYHHAYGLLGNRHEAEDMCQEAFARAYAAMLRVHELTAFYPWFYRILRNLCLNRLRQVRQTEELSDDSMVGSGPDAVLETDEVRGAVWAVLQVLKPEFREILLLKHLHEMSYDDISQLLEIPRGTVMSRLYHARKAYQYQVNHEDNRHERR